MTDYKSLPYYAEVLRGMAYIDEADFEEISSC
jgi:hypothetical protein